MNGPSAIRSTYPYRSEPRWSRSERVIARKVFDAALKRELQEVMHETKQKANQIQEPGEVWELERYLNQRRKEIDGKYDFRSSRLIEVLGRLLYERRITDQELQGLQEDKLKAICSCAKFLSENAA